MEKILQVDWKQVVMEQEGSGYRVGNEVREYGEKFLEFEDIWEGMVMWKRSAVETSRILLQRIRIEKKSLK